MEVIFELTARIRNPREVLFMLFRSCIVKF